MKIMVKKGIIVHDALAKHKINDVSVFRRACYMLPEVYRTQDAKSALANLHITCKCAQQEPIWNDMRNIIIMCDNVGA